MQLSSLSLSAFRQPSLLDAVALNPQPLPPRQSGSDPLFGGSRLDPAALNPQPLPPGGTGSVPGPLAWVGSINLVMAGMNGRF